VQNTFQPGGGNQMPPTSLVPKDVSVDSLGPQSFGNQTANGYRQPVVEDEQQGNLVEYWRTLRRRRGTLILISSLGLLLGILITLPQAPVYEAKTTLEVLELNDNFMNTKDVNQIQQGPSFNLQTDIMTQIKLLDGESLKGRTLAALGYKKPKDDSDANPLQGLMLRLRGFQTQDPRNGQLKMASMETKLKVSGQTRVIEALVSTTDAKVAAEYANRLTQEFIEQNMEARWQMTQRTGEFLTKQLDEMKVKLERSDDALQEYARRSGLIFTGEKTNVSEEKLHQLQEELTKAETDRVSKQSRWEMATSAPADSLPDVLNDLSLRDYQGRLSELRRQAAELSETYTPENAKVRRIDAQIAALQKSLSNQRADILKRIKNEYDEANRRERLLTAAYAAQTGIVTDQGEKAIQYNILKREVDSNRQIYDNMLQRMKEASVASALRASNVRVIDPATVPIKPSKPSIPINAALGLLSGIFFGIAFIVLTDRADRTIQEPADIALYLNLRELGLIPSGAAVAKHGRAYFYAKRAPKELEDGTAKSERLGLVTYQKKASLIAESFRAALASILFTRQSSRQPKTLVVTSPSPSEGKTTVVCNLAISIAETGQRVLLVDADIRKPRIHEIFDLSNEFGLTTLLQAREPMDLSNGHFVGESPTGQDSGLLPSSNGKGPDAEQAVASRDGRAFIHQTTMVPNLSVLCAGPPVSGATNLLYSPRMQEYVARFLSEYDMVIFDTPPMLTIVDARVIARHVDGVVLVVRAGKTTRDAAVAAQSRLREDGVHVIGTIMNDWNPKRAPGGYYGYYGGYHGYSKGKYGYGYGQKDGSKAAS
jgi:polysaccharide biosynthesis transport protein